MDRFIKERILAAFLCRPESEAIDALSVGVFCVESNNGGC